MKEQEIVEKIIVIVSEKTNHDDVELKSRLEDDLGCDSLDIIDLVMEMEREFSIAITDEEETRLRTVRDIINVVIDKLYGAFPLQDR